MIAALYVADGGTYSDLDGVDPWPEARDARAYGGPHPVVAHPPCARWSKYWFGGPGTTERFEKGADGGCFKAALASVRRWGGVLEHPAYTHAWKAFALPTPKGSGEWTSGVFDPGWTVHVEQGHYGHRARKASWLYVVGVWPLPALPRGRAHTELTVDGWRVFSRRQRAATPPAFRDLLIGLAQASRKTS